MRHGRARIRWVWLLLAGAIAAMLSVACGGPGGGEHVGSSTMAIVGGQEVDPNNYPAVGTLRLTHPGLEPDRCTATLIDEGIILTAASCVVRRRDCSPVLPVVSHGLTMAKFIAADGAHYDIDLANRRVYVPGQSFEQLTSPAFSAGVAFGLCEGGARNQNYYRGHHSEDVAVVGLSAPPDAQPAQLSSNVPFGHPIQGFFVWAGRTPMLTTEIYAPPPSSEMSHVFELADTCGPVQWVTGGLPVFMTKLACVPPTAPGLIQDHDRGGPLFALHLPNGFKVAGVATFPEPARDDWGRCLETVGTECTQGAYYNLWASVTAQLSFITQAIEWAKNDYDGDTVPNDDDNCPSRPNTAQDNANRDFEQSLLSRGAIELGNACDPSPVAQPWPGELGWVLDADLWERCTGDADLSDCVVRLERHQIDLETHWWSEDPSATTTARTGLRYCICRDENGQQISSKFICKNEHGCLIHNDEFAKTQGTGAGQTRWLRTSVRLWNAEHGNNVSYDVGSELFHRPYWDWESDAPEWKAAGFWDDPVSPPPGFSAGPYIAGLMWAHNDSVRGSSEHFPELILPCLGGVSDICGFGNSYMFWNPVSSIYLCPILPEIPEPVTDSSAGSQSGAAADAAEQRYFPEPSRVLDVPLPSTAQAASYLPFASVRLGGLVVSTGFAVPCETAAGLHLAELTLRAEDNVARLITEAFSPQLRTALLEPSDLQWVAASEPVELGGVTAAPLSVAVDPHTGGLAAAIAPDGTGGLGLAGCDVIPCGPIPASPPVIPATLGPTAYSRLRGEIAQLTGSSSSEPLDTVRTVPFFEPGTERELWPVEHRPMSVEAATYSWTDRRLWVVATDEDAPCTRCERYLLVIDTQTGRIERKRRLLPSLSRVWLTTTAAGEVVLVAAPGRGAVFVAAVFEPEQLGAGARVELSGVRVRVGRVMGAPRVSGDTLLVPVGSPSARRWPTDPRRHYVVALGLEELRDGIHGQCLHGQSQP